MILTTDRSPKFGFPAPTPLVLVEKARATPVSCVAGEPMCHGDLALTTAANLQNATSAGYGFLGRQGYVYPVCSSEPSCMPAGTQKLHTKCRSGIYQDCATFLENDRGSFEAQGFTTLFPGMSSSVLGYAYPVGDADGDGLVDAMEYLVGTSATDIDSDDDEAGDAEEYPLAGVPLSDPCSGPNVTCAISAEYVFQDGFE